MVWNQLTIDKPHVAYMILGGFPALFMLCSLFVKEKLYIGEATIATICGIIFGPYAANLFTPDTWGNVDKITLECSRIVLVVQCFAVGVELPRAYMERHWRSVTLLLVPAMTWGWLVTGLFIWWMVPPLNWLESLTCAACVTATDPVLASSVVGKGKFAKRVPKHLRDVLSAESGCNDGMAFPFVYLSIYLMWYRPHAGQVAFHWICFTILYECVLGAIYGFLLGYGARHAIRFAERKSLIDRESFLVFYFVLALFCAGSGSLLGMDDLLIGFSAGVGFSNDGWFTEKTEESHVSNVIDLLLNLAYFIYLGSVVPWSQFHNPGLGLISWRLVVLAILVILFRRIPIIMILKPIIPDIKTWREALFAGHFGPIGVGAIFACLLARAEIEQRSAQPLPESALPQPGDPNYYIIQLIWPITTFLVISSIVVHGSSIAVFTLGKRINTLTLTLSYTTATSEDGPSWMNRLPRVQSFSKVSFSFRKADSDLSSDRLPDYSPGTLPPIGIPGNFLRRVREGEEGREAEESIAKRAFSGIRPPRRRKRRASAGGPISQSAIIPQRRPEVASPAALRLEAEGDSERREVEGDQPEKNLPEEADGNAVSAASCPLGHEVEKAARETELQVYREGDHFIFEDEEGNAVMAEEADPNILEESTARFSEMLSETLSASSTPFERDLSPHEVDNAEPTDSKGEFALPSATWPKWLGKWDPFGWMLLRRRQQREQQQRFEEPEVKSVPFKRKRKSRTRQSARAYQFGNTIILEDKDGEVIRKYTIPSEAKASQDSETVPNLGSPTAPHNLGGGLSRMGAWIGMRDWEGGESSTAAGWRKVGQDGKENDSDDGLRFTLASRHVPGAGPNYGHPGRRMSKQDFIREMGKLDSKGRRNGVEKIEKIDRPIRAIVRDEIWDLENRESLRSQNQLQPLDDHGVDQKSRYDLPTTLATPLERQQRDGGSSDLDGNHIDARTDPVPPRERRSAASPFLRPEDIETPAEKKRRLAALGQIDNYNDEDDDEEAELAGRPRRPRGSVSRESDSEDDGEPRVARGQVLFADGLRPARRRGGAGEVGMLPLTSDAETASGRWHRPRVSWGGERGRDQSSA